MTEQIDTLGDALTREIARVRDQVLPVYLGIGVAGQFGVAMIRAALDRAGAAMVRGDIVGMVSIYRELKDFEL